MAQSGISLQNVIGTIPLFNGSVPFFGHYVIDLIYHWPGFTQSTKGLDLR